MRIYSRLAGALAGMAVHLCAAGNAETIADGAASAAESAAAPGSAIAEIVVTAQKRAQNSQDVPLAVASVTPATLAEVNLKSLTDLNVLVPSLTVQNTNGYLTAAIRGVGSNSVGPGYEGQVALYIDGVYMGVPNASLLNYSNVQQIDVLKGPQGTLFGRNATAGVVQVTTKDPTTELSGLFDVGYGNFQRFYGDGYLSGALTSTIKGDVAFYYATQGQGYGTNAFNGEDINRVVHNVGVRSKVVIEPFDGTKVTLSGDYSENTNTNTAVGAPGTINGIIGGPPQASYGWGGNFDGPDRFTNRAAGAGINWEQRLGAVDLVSITAYRHSTEQFDFDYDYSPANVFDIFAHQPDQQFSEELRLQSRGKSDFTWLVGAFYYSSRSGWEDFLLTIPPAGQNVIVHDVEKGRSIAGFAQGSYLILPDTNLTLGIRYTRETHDERDGSTTITAYPSGVPLVAIPTAPQSISAADPTYRLSLDHRFTPELLAYVSFNTGFKSGGFNAGPVGSPAYSPEKVKSYELGIKSDLLDRIRLNVAGFYNDYSNIQIQELLGGSIGVVNGPSAKIYGGEADLSARISHNLRFTSGITALSPTFGTFEPCHITPPGGGIPAELNGDCSNKQVPLAARVSANAGLDYTVHNVLGGELTVNGHAYYTSRFYWDVGNNYVQGGYTTFGAAASWVDPSDRFTARVYGNNLSNKLVGTWVGINENAGNINQQYLEPRLYGVALGYKF